MQQISGVVTRFKHSRAAREAPWTASRCNRTLRQLTAFLARLEKWHKDFSRMKAMKALKDLGANHAVKSRQNLDVEAPEFIDRDPSWLPGRELSTRKRNVKTYKKKAKLSDTERVCAQPAIVPMTPQLPRAASGHISADTPMMPLSGSSDGHASGIHHVPSELIGRALQAPARKCSRPENCRHVDKTSLFSFDQDRRLVSAGSYDEIVLESRTIIINFLAATSEIQAAQDWAKSRPVKALNRGTRSLLSTCLRQTHKTITHEQQVQCDLPVYSHDGRIQVASSLFSELEEFYGNSRQGWSPLRVITRQYGIYLICHAIRSGNLRLSVAQAIAELLFCHPMLIDAAEAITEAMIEVQSLTHVKDLQESLCNCDGMPGLRVLAASQVAMAFRLRMFDLAFSRQDKILPIEWVSSEPNPSKLAITHSFRTCAPLSAASLVKTIFLRCLRLRWGDYDQTLQQLRSVDCDDIEVHCQTADHCSANLEAAVNMTFRSGIVRLISMQLVQSHHSSRKHTDLALADNPALDILRDVMTTVQHEMTANGVASLEAGQLHKATLFFYCSYIAFQITPGRDVSLSALSSFEELISGFQSWRALLGDLSMLTCDIVGACQRFSDEDGVKYIKLITSCLVVPGLGDFPTVQLLLANVAADAAMSNAQRQKTKESQEVGSEMQQQLAQLLAGNTATLPTPSMMKFASGYRWDDNIDEWIAKTPGPGLQRESEAEVRSMTSVSARSCKQSGYETARRPSMRDIAIEMPMRATRTVFTPPISRSPPIEHDFKSKSKSKSKKRKSAPADWEQAWDGDFAFKKPAKRSKSLGDAHGQSSDSDLIFFCARQPLSELVNRRDMSLPLAHMITRSLGNKRLMFEADSGDELGEC